MEVVYSFEGQDPRKDAGRLVLQKSRPISFCSSTWLSLPSFVSPIPSLGRNRQGTRAPLPAASVRTCRSPASHFFSSIFSCRYACQAKRPPNSNSVFLLLMPFPSQRWWAASKLSHSFAFPFVRSFSLVPEPPVASAGIERQEALKRSATRVQHLGKQAIYRAGGTIGRLLRGHPS
jgi:hypothetical protein